MRNCSLGKRRYLSREGGNGNPTASEGKARARGIGGGDRLKGTPKWGIDRSARKLVLAECYIL